MATLDDVYWKFGFAAEASQLLETQLGSLLFAHLAGEEGLFEAEDPDRAGDLLDGVNRQTPGRLVKRLGKFGALDRIVDQLAHALKERNRLSHSFFREHNLRRNSEAGRNIVLADLEQIHTTLLSAYKAVMLLSGVDIDALVAASDQGGDKPSASGEIPDVHLPI